LKAVIFAGSSTVQFVKGSRKRAGDKKRFYVRNVRFLLPSWPIGVSPWNTEPPMEKEDDGGAFNK
jgi:hypothetical protein